MRGKNHANVHTRTVTRAHPNKQDEMIYGTQKDLLSVVFEISVSGKKQTRKENKRKEKNNKLRNQSKVLRIKCDSM